MNQKETTTKQKKRERNENAISNNNFFLNIIYLFCFIVLPRDVAILLRTNFVSLMGGEERATRNGRYTNTIQIKPADARECDAIHLRSGRYEIHSDPNKAVRE